MELPGDAAPLGSRDAGTQAAEEEDVREGRGDVFDQAFQEVQRLLDVAPPAWVEQIDTASPLVGKSEVRDNES